MRVGIYNRWLHTLGGGERETGAFAEVLQADHDVDLIAHDPIDVPSFARHFNIVLPRVRLRLVASDPEYRAVRVASADYDLFLNISHLDLFTPQARRNVLRVFFPARSEHEANNVQRRYLGWWGAPLEPSWLELIGGVYQPETDADRPFAWTGPQVQARLHRRATLPTAQLQAILHGWRPEGVAPAQVRLLANNEVIGERVVPTDGAWIDWRVPLPPHLARETLLNVQLQTTAFQPRAVGLNSDSRDLGVALAALRLLPGGRRGTAALNLAERNRAGVPDQAGFRHMQAYRVHRIARSYDLVLANSRFTQQWIERRWAVPSEIIYPPVDTAHFKPGKKQSIILSVGRFFAGSHNKKHLAMIQAFRSMYDAGLRGWEYHLAGGCDETRLEHRTYLEQVRTAAKGYPITLHVNAPFAELQQLYSAASIFWHATGYGEDEQRDPDSFEHFGITTVEAMAAGCVPVVIAKAGQIEIVMPDESGLLWHTLDQLQAHTRRLIGDAALRERLAAGALARSHTFEFGAFATRARALLDE